MTWRQWGLWSQNSKWFGPRNSAVGGEQCYSLLQLHCPLIKKIVDRGHPKILSERIVLLGIAQFSSLGPSDIVGENTALLLHCYPSFDFPSLTATWMAGGEAGEQGEFQMKLLWRQLIHSIEIAENHFQFQFWIFEEDRWPNQLEWLSQPDNDFLLTEIWSLTSDSDKKLDNSIYVVYQSTFKFESAPRQRRKFNLTTLKMAVVSFSWGAGCYRAAGKYWAPFFHPIGDQVIFFDIYIQYFFYCDIMRQRNKECVSVTQLETK